jgi:WD40 repeat protein
MISEMVTPAEKSSACPTCIGASESGNVVVIGYSDDSMILHDVRSGYRDKIRLEVGSHTDTVKSIVFSKHDGDFLCLTGGSDCKMKLWDLRQRKCIRDYGGNDDDLPMVDWGLFHSDSIWSIEPNSTFEQCFSGGRDGQIYHTDLVQDQHTLMYDNNKNPISSMTLDEENDKLWFTSSNDSSLRCLDFKKRSYEKV